MAPVKAVTGPPIMPSLYPYMAPPKAPKAAPVFRAAVEHEMLGELQFGQTVLMFYLIPKNVTPLKVARLNDVYLNIFWIYI